MEHTQLYFEGDFCVVLLFLINPLLQLQQQQQVKIRSTSPLVNPNFTEQISCEDVL